MGGTHEGKGEAIWHMSTERSHLEKRCTGIRMSMSTIMNMIMNMSTSTAMDMKKSADAVADTATTTMVGRTKRTPGKRL